MVATGLVALALCLLHVALVLHAVEYRLMLVTPGLLPVPNCLFAIQHRLVPVTLPLLAVAHGLLAVAFRLDLVALVLVALQVQPARHTALRRRLCPYGEQSEQGSSD